jgi:hypothetical protein
MCLKGYWIENFEELLIKGSSVLRLLSLQAFLKTGDEINR